MIEGVKVKKLLWKKDERGRLAEILRSDHAMFKGFWSDMGTFESLHKSTEFLKHKAIENKLHTHRR